MIILKNIKLFFFVMYSYITIFHNAPTVFSVGGNSSSNLGRAPPPLHNDPYLQQRRNDWRVNSLVDPGSDHRVVQPTPIRPVPNTVWNSHPWMVGPISRDPRTVNPSASTSSHQGRVVLPVTEVATSLTVINDREVKTPVDTSIPYQNRFRICKANIEGSYSPEKYTHENYFIAFKNYTYAKMSEMNEDVRDYYTTQMFSAIYSSKYTSNRPSNFCYTKRLELDLVACFEALSKVNVEGRMDWRKTYEILYLNFNFENFTRYKLFGIKDEEFQINYKNDDPITVARKQQNINTVGKKFEVLNEFINSYLNIATKVRKNSLISVHTFCNETVKKEYGLNEAESSAKKRSKRKGEGGMNRSSKTQCVKIK